MLGFPSNLELVVHDQFVRLLQMLGTNTLRSQVSSFSRKKFVWMATTPLIRSETMANDFPSENNILRP